MCTINYAKRMELRNEKLMEAGLVEKAEAAEAAAEDLEKCIKKKVKLSSPLALDMARLLDSGFDGPEALHWSRVVYLPTAKTSEITLSTRVKEWVRLTVLEAAFDEQAVRIRNTKVSECPISRCRASVFDEWEHRWSYHPDSSNRYWKTGSEISFMTDNHTSTAGGSSSKRQSREEEGEEDETEAAAITQKTSTTNSEYDLQPITADKDNLRPLFEIVLEKKITGKTEPVGPAAGPQMEMAPISPPLKETQKRKPGGSSTRMENVAKIEPHEQDPDSEKKRTEKETIDPSLMGAQGPESGKTCRKG